MSEPIKFKILTIGDTGVGKTSLLIRHQNNEFREETKNTIGIDFTQKTYNIEGKRYDLAIWDTAGQERFRALTKAYYRDAQAVFIVFDITNIETLHNVDHWVEDLNDSFRKNENESKPIIILVGNKKDLPNEKISQREINDVVEKHKISMYISTSAKTGEHVDKIFETLLELLVKRTRSNSKTYTVQNSVSGNGRGILLKPDADGGSNCCK
jgi:small GTP-binding protein